MKVLLAGGTGFVGGRAAQALAQAGHEVVIASRRAAGAGDYPLRAIDWADPASLRAACTGMDAVIHAAGMNAQGCAADPAAALAINGVGTAALAAAAQAAGAPRMFYLSTAHVYGSPLSGEIAEDTCPRNMHPYASSHLAGEYALQHALNGGKIAGCVLRLSNGFGAPAHAQADCWMLLVNDLCRQAVREGALTLASTGAQLRDFVPLSAVTDAICALLPAPATDLPRVINIASGNTVSVLQMAQRIAARAKVVLGADVPLRLGSRAETAVPFWMSTALMGKLNLAPFDDDAEIDALLAFCQNHFAP